MDQRNEAEVAQLLLAAVSDGDFGWALERDFAVVGLEGMRRQVFDQATAFHTANGCAPAEVFKRGRQACAEGPGGVAPQVLAVVGAVHVFDKVEAFNGGAVLRVVRQTAQEARQGQANVARILRLAEGLPLGVFHRVEHLGQVARLA